MPKVPTFTAWELPKDLTPEQAAANRFTLQALEAHKREGLELAVRARWIALAVIAVMLPFLNTSWNVLYFEFFLGLFALNGYLQRKYGQVGRSGIELLLLFVDLAMLTYLFTVPPPFWEPQHPHAMTFRFGNFMYFFVLLAAGLLMYNWKTILAMGHWTVGLWTVAVGCIWMFGTSYPELTEAVEEIYAGDALFIEFLDPNTLYWELRLQELVVFVIVAYILSVSARRSTRLLLGNAALERERANLSRYFSPNVVDDLSQNDTPLREVREQEVAVMFVDIVGFTSYAAERPAREVIETLRAFHGRMEACVFAEEGTLDKYLGDGLMATFGTPVAGQNDAARALACARSILETVADLNIERHARGKIALQVSVGVHVGPVVLGDIGTNRLEFAVIGNTVNVASRMEGMTRALDASCVLSDEAFAAARDQGADMRAFEAVDGQAIRGVSGDVRVWCLRD